MVLIGCDYHPSWQQVCWVDTETGETAEQKLVHAAGDAEIDRWSCASPTPGDTCSHNLWPFSWP